MLPFSERLKHETTAQHEAAESSAFISSLMKGERDATDYARLIGQYLHLYRALEFAVAQVRHQHPELHKLLDPELERFDLLSADYRSLAQEHGLDMAPVPTAATAQYVSRLHVLAQQENDLDAYRVLAHHYLRYLGDLSGGQIISALVDRHYGVPTQQRTAWHFSSIPKLKAYKDQYRILLAEAVTEIRAQDALIVEAQYGFDLNRELFNSLDERKELAPTH
ncbi:biliverdin-producing heme oxygenase [Micrococcoides hystricis]|uniref:Heme oxygenase (Biliverdin-producing) n=1 Tax=Micrococcoides hystricis TaxID=1572761 RepID=A0ABV6PAL4_9MICC